MRCPPFAVTMQVVDEDRSKFRLWLPLFILWPLLSVFLLLTLVVAVLADAAGLISGHRPGYVRFLIGVLRTVTEARGTEVFIRDKNRTSRTVALTVL